MWTEQRFSTQVQLPAPDTGLLGSEVIFRLNSIYNPQLGSGVTTYGQPTMVTLYDRYVVTDVGIDVEFTDPTADGLYCFAMVQRGLGSTSLNGLQPPVAMDIPGVFCGPLNNTGGQTLRCTQQFSIGKIEGLTNSQVFDEMDLYGAASNADPARTPYLRVAGTSLSSGTTENFFVTVKLTYRTKWYSRKELV